MAVSILFVVRVAFIFTVGCLNQSVLTYSLGREFAVSLPNHNYGGEPELYLLVESRYETTTLYIEVPFSGLKINKTVYKGVTRVDLNTSLAEHTEERPNNAFYIQSHAPVSIHLMDYVDYSADGILLLPISNDNIDYYAVTYNFGESQIAVTTLYDNTIVTITVKSASGSFLYGKRSYSDGDVISVHLNRLESIQIQHSADLTGTHLTSNNPISVISGDHCVNIGDSACDHIIEQLPPVSAWGVTFVIRHLRTRNVNTFKILSAYDNTRIKISSVGTVILQDGDSIVKRISHDSAISIEANKPILVVQYAETTTADTQPGDPFMAVIPSVEHFSDTYLFLTPKSFASHHLTITVDTNQVQGLRLNGLSVDRTDEQTIDVLHEGTYARFSVIRIDLKNGTYNLTHSSVKFGALLYGFGEYISYGYSLGYDLNVILGIKLSHGNTSKSGSLQLNIGGTSTHICADDVGLEEVRVICRSLGYDKYPLMSTQSLLNTTGETGDERRGSLCHAQWHGAIQRQPQFNATVQLLPVLKCSGNEARIEECDITYGNIHSCSTTDLLVIDCAPQLSQIIQSQCTASSWTIGVDMDKLKYRYPGSVATDVYFGDNSCHGTLVGNHLHFNYNIHSCLTTQSETKDDLVYSNQLVYAYHDPINPFIIRNYNWTLDVTCLVQRNESTNSHVAYNQSTAVDAYLNSTIQYKPKVQLFSDPNFVTPIPGSPIQVPLGSNIYVKTYIENIDWNIRMKLQSCYTTPSQALGDTKYYVIRNGCEVDSNTHLILAAAHETRFVFSMFEMTSNHHNLYLHCDATICDTSDPTSLSQCRQQCGLGR